MVAEERGAGQITGYPSGRISYSNSTISRTDGTNMPGKAQLPAVEDCGGEWLPLCPLPATSARGRVAACR
jgi:hypothetical protein